jgi:hypothetical protein
MQYFNAPRAAALALLAGIAVTVSATAQPLQPHQQQLRDIYKELVEINTTHSVGDTQVAAEAMAARLRGAGRIANLFHLDN